MTQIQILNVKRNLAGYIEVSYKMTFTLPAIFGTGANPIEGLGKIAASYPDNFCIEIIPVVGTVIVYTNTASIDGSITLPAARTLLQNKYAAIRAQLDGLTLTPYDTISGQSWDGTSWTTTSLITDLPVVQGVQSNLAVTATGLTGAGVTATLPAVISKFHNIAYLEITAYSTSARTGNATPIIVATTNILGTPSFTFATAAAAGTTDVKTLVPSVPIRSSIANTATTIVAPATIGVIWRINCFYNVNN